MKNLPEDFSQEAFLAMGVAGLLIVGVAILVAFVVMVGSLKLSIKWVGGKDLSLVACFGWLCSIAFVNSFVMVGFTTVFGQAAGLIAMPVTWFTTLYMLSVAADCGLVQALGVWIVNAILGTVGMFAVILMMIIPLAMIGSSVQGTADSAAAETTENVANHHIDANTAESSAAPEATPVVLQSRQATSESESRPDANENAGNRTEADDSQVKTKPSPVERTRSRRSKPIERTPVPKQVIPSGATPSTKDSELPKAGDGSTLNPFFKN